jgi:hypothetical protein
VYCVADIVYCVLYFILYTILSSLYRYSVILLHCLLFITLLLTFSPFVLTTQGVTVFAVIIVVLVVSAVFYLQIFMTSPEQLDRFTINGFNATNIITSLLSAIAIAVSTVLSCPLLHISYFIFHIYIHIAFHSVFYSFLFFSICTTVS